MSRGSGKRAVLIAGPTASGKSALGLRLAQEQGGIIINADAMQVYDVLRVVTARPSPEDMRVVPHLLYGTVSPAVRYSTGDWLRAVQAILADRGCQERPVFVVGGTGLYFDALVHGFAEVPAVPSDVVAEVERQVAGLDRAGRARLLAERDPEMAARLQAHDPQRVVRALAVLQATGRSLASYRARGEASPLAGYAIERVLIDPGREVLRQRIAQRFELMLETGAVEEVQQLRALHLDPTLPAMKAIGVEEISAWLDGRLTREQAVERAVVATRQYAKRQRTWFRNRMPDWTRLG